MVLKLINVVGNVFKNLSDGEDIVSFEESLEIVERRDLEKASFAFGQGVSESQILEFKSVLEKNENSNKIDLISYFDNYSRCPNELTHKHKSCNTLISEPIKSDDKTFKSLLMIDDRCAELSDHVAGKHIQFMILIEAARQMVNAVTEKYYSNSRMIYLANDVSSEFKNFIYPFLVDMTYKVNEKKIKIGENGKMSIEIDFMQFNRLCVKFYMNFTILDRKFVTSIEDEAIRSYIRN